MRETLEKSAAMIYGLIYKWSLIDHANSEQGIVAWKEDAHCYNDGVIIWKDKWPNGLVKIKMATDNGEATRNSKEGENK